MKKSILLFIVFSSFLANAQVVNITSFQHTMRWLDEVRFPPYITQQNVKDSILQAVAAEAGKHFNNIEVIKPQQLEYKTIDMFGKPKMKDPAPASNATDMQAAVFSLVTRATAGFAVLWRMKVVVNQDGKTVYSREIEHELEFSSVSGYMSPVRWFSEEKYIQLYKTLLAELFENREALANKIAVSNIEDKDAEAKKEIADPELLMVKTNGNILGEGNFILSLQHDTDTLSTVVYHEGWNLEWPKISMSKIAADFFASKTHLIIGYDTKSKEKRFGRLAYTNGRDIRLRIEWMELTHQSTDGSMMPAPTPITPMVVEAFENDKMIAYFVFITRHTIESKGYPHSISTLAGKIGEDSVAAEYDPFSQFITIKESDKIKAMILMENMNPDSRSFSNSTLSKNKVFVSTGTGKAKFKEPEWYNWYYEKGHTNTDTAKYLDILLCLFFGMGKE